MHVIFFIQTSTSLAFVEACQRSSSLFRESSYLASSQKNTAAHQVLFALEKLHTGNKRKLFQFHEEYKLIHAMVRFVLLIGEAVVVQRK